MLLEEIEALASSIGIDAIGFVKAYEFTHYALHDSKRGDPKLSLPDAESIIIAGIYIGGLTLPSWENYWYGRTSRLYLSGYFLDVVKPLEPITELLKGKGYKAIICESSSNEKSILPLKLAAIRAGFGWQGKNSLLISKKYGSFLAIGGIITNAELDYNVTEEINHCGTCNICQKDCPLDALVRPHVLNKDKCLSYLLQVDNLPDCAQSVMENRVGDCEICQQSCPWNKKHISNPLKTKLTVSFEKKRKELESLFYLPDLYRLSKEDYQKKLGFLNTDIPYEIFHRNVSIALSRAKNVKQNND